VVECTALEMRHRCKPIGGSNPSLSATLVEGPSTTLAECVCAAVFHGFVSGSMDTVQTAAEG
jgi:hypothetical protein